MREIPPEEPAGWERVLLISYCVGDSWPMVEVAHICIAFRPSPDEAEVGILILTFHLFNKMPHICLLIQPSPGHLPLSALQGRDVFLNYK